MKIKKNGKYLIQVNYGSGSNSSIHKIEIEDETKTCYKVFWEDTNRHCWELKTRFKAVAYSFDSSAEYEIIEDLNEGEDTETEPICTTIELTNANQNN